MTFSLTKKAISNKIYEKAKELGFTDCGFMPAQYLNNDAVHLKNWLENGMHADMKYMENHFEKRTDPSKLVPGAKSLIVLLANYYPAQKQTSGSYKISKYAYGQDYHHVIKGMLKNLAESIDKTITPHRYRYFVDSAPVLERAAAAKAGLGWIGKNANLISPKHGSFVFISEIITDLELEYGKTINDHCGGCQKCIVACPTQAIVTPKTIDSRLCISYQTIENKDEIPPTLKGTFNDWIFGCDICQDVCPWNRKSIPHDQDKLQASNSILTYKKEDWIHLKKEDFNKIFKKSAVKRTKFEGLKRNIAFNSTVEK